MNVLEFVVREAMNKNIKLGYYVTDRNWLLVRGITDDDEVDAAFAELVNNYVDWAFVKEKNDDDNPKYRISWTRKPPPRAGFSEQIQGAIERGEIFDTVDVVI